MEPVYVTRLAGQNSEWLGMRQAVIAENVANANTPGFRSKDVEPFSAIFDQTKLNMASTRPGHMQALDGVSEAREVEREDSWDVTHSGNSVSLEQEMVKAGEVARGHALTSNIVKSLHRMMLMSVKG